MRRIAVALLFLLGLGLRLWNAETAIPHPVEYHATADARWMRAPLDWDTKMRFLREHPRDHLMLDPDTGTLIPWEKKPSRLPGHPALLAWTLGPVMALVQPTSGQQGRQIVRRWNAVADACAVLLLPALTAALGAAPAAGVLAAALYAVFPPSLGYGTLALTEPMSAPLIVLLLVLLLRHDERPGRWLAAGVVTGLLLASSLGGTVGVLLGPAVFLLLAPVSLAGLGVWFAGAAAVLALLVSPTAWVSGLLTSPDGFSHLHFAPARILPANLAYASDTASWYFLGFARHGGPFAVSAARWHGIVTPAYLLLFAASFVVALARRRVAQVLCLYVPCLVALAMMPPNDGLFRLYPLYPLVCAGIACALADVPRWGRVVLVLAAAGWAAYPMLPDRLNGYGQVDLPTMVLVNPAVPQPNGFYSAERPFQLAVGLSQTVSRRLWLPPGRYEVRVLAEGMPKVAIDGQVVLDGVFRFGPQKRGGELELDGWLHELVLGSGGSRALFGAVVIRPVTPETPPAN